MIAGILSAVAIALYLIIALPVPAAAADAITVIENAECRQPKWDYRTRTKCAGILVDERIRTFRHYIPKSDRPNSDRPKPDAAMPLVIVLHGGGGMAAGVEASTRFQLTQLAREEKFAVVYPDAFEKHWNDGRDAIISIAHIEKIDDVKFIEALIDDMAGRTNVDLHRVFVTGISNGGMMSLRLACELSHRARAVAAVVGNLADITAASCAPANPVSVLVVNGTLDPLVPYQGGFVTDYARRRGKVISTDATMEIFRTAGHCAGTAEVLPLPDRDRNDASTITQYTWGNCDDGARVRLLKISGGGHTWPGTDHVLRRLTGVMNNDIKGSEVLWAFFNEAE